MFFAKDSSISSFLVFAFLGILLQLWITGENTDTNNGSILNEVTDSKSVAYNEVLHGIKRDLYKNKFLYLSSTKMKNVLKALGATDSDMELYLKEVFGRYSKVKDPVCNNRYLHTRSFLYQKDHIDQNVEDIFHHNASILPHVTARLDDPAFEALNGGLNYRPMAKLDDWAVFNSVHTALHKFIVHLFDPSARKLPPESSEMNNLMVTDYPLRYVIGNDVKKSQLTPEGIHQDGNQITFMMLGARNNLASESGESRLFTLDAPNGPYGIAGGRTNITEAESRKEEEDRERFMIFNRVMMDPFETVVTLDQEVKHEGRGKMIRINPDENAERGVFLIFAKRPNANGWNKEHEGVSMKHAQKEYNMKGSINHLFLDHEEDFKNKEKIFFENLKAKGASFPGQETGL